MTPELWNTFRYLWAAISFGTLMFLSVLALTAFKTGGMTAFRRLKINISTLILILMVASVFFPVAWFLIFTSFKKEKS